MARFKPTRFRAEDSKYNNCLLYTSVWAFRALAEKLPKVKTSPTQANCAGLGLSLIHILAKDGTRRGGRRVRAGDKPKALSDKIAEGKDADIMEFHTPELDAADLDDAADLTGADMPSPSAVSYTHLVYRNLAGTQKVSSQYSQRQLGTAVLCGTMCLEYPDSGNGCGYSEAGNCPYFRRTAVTPMAETDPADSR